MRGFASLDAEKRREICSRGGKAAHAAGTAHEFTPEEARAAGSKGGNAVAADKEHMRRIGRIGGLTAAKNKVMKNGNTRPPIA